MLTWTPLENGGGLDYYGEICAGPEVSHGENMVVQACNADEQVLLVF